MSFVCSITFQLSEGAVPLILKMMGRQGVIDEAEIKKILIAYGKEYLFNNPRFVAKVLRVEINNSSQKTLTDFNLLMSR